MRKDESSVIIKVLVSITILFLLTVEVSSAQAYAGPVCTCYSPICRFIAEWQPNGKPGDGQEEFLLFGMEVPEYAVFELTSGWWICDSGRTK